MNYNYALKLYYGLADKALNNQACRVPAAHSSLFMPDQQMSTNYYNHYVNHTKSNFSTFVQNNNAICSNCKNFHLGNLKHINKDSDIMFGNQLENIFMEYFNQVSSDNDLGLHCSRADEQNLHMPDFKVEKGGEVSFYMEFKAIFRPFVMISRNVNPDYNCYSHSMTLDVCNGKKLEEQRNLVNEIGIDKVRYVYWYDIPCIKGIFWMPASMVYSIWDKQDSLYERKNVEGDMNRFGGRRGSVKKIYLPLFDMNDFSSLFNI